MGIAGFNEIKMLRNRHIVRYVVSLIMMGALGCPVSLWAQSAHYINTAGTTLETRFTLPAGYERIPVGKNSYAYFLRRLRMLPYSATYNNDLPENHQVSMLNLPLMDNIEQDIQFQDIHLCVRLRGEYLFSREQYDKIAFSIAVKRIFYIEWAKGLELVINDKRHWTQQKYGIDRLGTFQNYLFFIFYHSNINTILLDTQPIPINDIMPGDMFIQAGFPGAAVMVLDVAANSATGDRIFLLAGIYKSLQTVYVLVNPKEAWSGSPWYSIKAGKEKVVTPNFVFYKTDLRRFQERYTSTTAKR